MKMKSLFLRKATYVSPLLKLKHEVFRNDIAIDKVFRHEINFEYHCNTLILLYCRLAYKTLFQYKTLLAEKSRFF